MRYLILAALASCSLDADYTGTYFECGENGECPDGYICLHQVCIPTEPDPTTCSEAVAAGEDHTCIIRSGDDSVWCWGRNNSGQLGNGVRVDSNTPVQVEGIAGATLLSVGGNHSCAVVGGTAFCWGEGGSGELGDNSNGESATPVQVQNLADITAIASGDNYNCAIATGGVVSCWGGNEFGQLGDGTEDARGVASPVFGSPTADQLVIGGDTTCVVKAGVLSCWGENFSGQIMNNDPVNQSKPVVAMASDVAGVGIGGDTVCFFNSAGEVFCAGEADDGELGNGEFSDVDALLPVKTGLTAKIIGLALGPNIGCAFDAAGTSWCWGRNDSFKLGNGNFQNRAFPVATLFAPVQAMAVGGGHTCVREQSGAIACVGFNGFGQLGNGDRISQGAPQTVEGLSNIRSISVGGSFSCAVEEAGGAQCWGENDDGELGDGGLAVHATPAPVNLANIRQLVAGANHACAVLDDESVHCWGNNEFGQLGDGTDTSRGTPLPVSGLGTPIRQLVAGDNHTCAISGSLTASTLQCWGANFDGRLGTGDTTSSSVPVTATIANPVAVAAGEAHTCVLDSGSNVICFGDGDFGTLGNNDNVGSTTPVAVQDTTGAPVTGGVEIQARGQRTFVRAGTPQRILGWGQNCEAGIGIGDFNCTTDQAAELSLGSIATVVQIAAGYDASCARTDTMVFCWGPNYFGQVGDGTYQTTADPVILPGLAASDISVGGSHACVVRTDKTVACWGFGPDGQLGDGVVGTREPTSVRLTCQ